MSRVQLALNVSNLEAAIGFYSQLFATEPAKVRPGAHMPALFAADRTGFVERWILAEFLTQGGKPQRDNRPSGDHRAGRMAFLGLGCAACHFLPDLDRVRSVVDGCAHS